MDHDDAPLGAPWTKSGLLDCGEGRLRYATCGQGEPLVLLPKLGGWIADWRQVAALLCPSFRVIAIDPPGHGGSRMAGSPAYLHTVAESAASIIAGLDTIGIDRFSVAGSSLGGCIGIALAAMWPDQVRKLALVGVSLAARMSFAALAASDAAQPAGTNGADGQPLPRTAADLERFGPLSDAIVREQNASRAACGLWLRPSERGVGRMGIESYLPRLRQPVLVINGALGFYARYNETARRLIADVRVLEIPSGGSFVHQEQPDPVAAAIAAFLDE